MQLSGKHQYNVMVYDRLMEVMIYSEILPLDKFSQMQKHVDEKWEGDAMFAYSHELTFEEWKNLEIMIDSWKK